LRSVLVLCDHYLPGYKAGGPIRSLANVVDRLGAEFHFKVVTRDRDSGDDCPYFEIGVNQWNSVGNAMVLYLSGEKCTLSGLKEVLCSVDWDLCYLNSFFSPTFAIKPLLLRELKLIPKRPVLIAPRGEFSKGALRLKAFKKIPYVILSRLANVYRDVLWQASSVHEEHDIRRWHGKRAQVFVAPNLARGICSNGVDKPLKHPGVLKIAFLSRISRKKNLDGALKILNGVKGKIYLNIYGPTDDARYCAYCMDIVSSLPSNIVVKFHGDVPYEDVVSKLRKNDLFFLPTHGENFGHTILEAFSSGVPVLISNKTPWRDLEAKGIGWDVSLDQPRKLRGIIENCVYMDADEYQKWSKRAEEYAFRIINDDAIVSQNRQLFPSARQCRANS